MTSVMPGRGAAGTGRRGAAAIPGSYLEAADGCLRTFRMSRDASERAALIEQLEEFAYALRPMRGDSLPRVFAPLDSLIEGELANACPPAVQAGLVAGRARRVAWQEPARGLPMAREALAMAEAAGDSVATFAALFAMHHALEDPALFEERRAVSTRMLAAARSSGSLRELTIAHWRSLIDAWCAADSASFDYHLARFVSGAAQLDDPHWDAMASSARAARALYEGRYEECAEEARAAMASGIPSAMDASAVQLMVLNNDQGRQRELDPAIVAIFAANRALYLPYRVGLATYLMASGRLTEARAEIALAPLAALPVDGSYLVTVSLTLDICNNLLNDEEMLTECVGRLAPYSGRNAILGDGVACFGPVDLFLGCVAVRRGDTEAMQRHMELAYHVAARMRGRPWLARMSRDLAAAFGPDSAGHAYAQEGLAIAAELGMRGVAAQGREMLRAREARPAQRAPEERFGKELTPRESEILEMLIAGKTARTIADALVLSTRTVQKHIEHIYEKLGVQTRYELVARGAATPDRIN